LSLINLPNCYLDVPQAFKVPHQIWKQEARVHHANISTWRQRSPARWSADLMIPKNSDNYLAMGETGRYASGV
jgi:hypothetical protein